MKKRHISLSDGHDKKLLEFQKTLGYTSISRTIEFLITERSIASRIDTLIKVIESNYTHKSDTAGGENELPAGVFKGSELKRINYEEAA